MIFFFKSFHAISHESQDGLKEMFYNNKMPTYAELMEILKPNEIRGHSYYTKSKLIDLLVKRELIPAKHGNNKQEHLHPSTQEHLHWLFFFRQDVVIPV